MAIPFFPVFFFSFWGGKLFFTSISNPPLNFPISGRVIATNSFTTTIITKYGWLKLQPPIDQNLHTKISVKCLALKYLDNNSSLQNWFSRNGSNRICQISNFSSIPSSFDFLFSKIKSIKKTLIYFLKSPIARGVLLGEPQFIDQLQRQAFQEMGVSHLFATSGLHMGILFLGISKLLNIFPQILLKRFLIVFFCFIFLAILEFKISLLRAFCFLIIYIFSPPCLKYRGFYSLLYASIICIIFFPGSEYSISFFLSFTMTGFILLWIRGISAIFPKFISKIISIVLITFFPSILFSHFIFNHINPLSWLHNLFLVPYTGVYIFLAPLVQLFNFQNLGDLIFIKLIHVHYFLSFVNYHKLSWIHLIIICIVFFIMTLINLFNKPLIARRTKMTILLLLPLLILIPGKHIPELWADWNQLTLRRGNHFFSNKIKNKSVNFPEKWLIYNPNKKKTLLKNICQAGIYTINNIDLKKCKGLVFISSANSYQNLEEILKELGFSGTLIRVPPYSIIKGNKALKIGQIAGIWK